MPEITITKQQRTRLESVQQDIGSVYVGEYGSVCPKDALEYLLDTYTPPEEKPSESAGTGRESSTKEEDTTEPAEQDGAARLKAMMQMLDDHDDKWSESESGDEPYEVELPDGSTESARTKDDIRRLLFKHYHE